MASVIERADQLVLDYVSKAADAAHGVLQPRQRINFVAVLRRRIDAERAGTDDPVVVERVLARFGDPAVLVRRELRRLGVQPPFRAGGVVTPVVPLAAPTPDDSAPDSDPAGPAGRAPGDLGVPAPRRAVRGHPYASTGGSPDAAPPPREAGQEDHGLSPSSSATTGDDEDGPAVPGDGSDEWEDEVESDPPTEEIPLIRDPSPPEAEGRGRQEAAPAAPEASGAARPESAEETSSSEAPGEGPEGAVARPGLPPGVARGIRKAEERLARRRLRGQRGWPGRRSLGRSGEGRWSPGRSGEGRWSLGRSGEEVTLAARDPRTILLSHRRETVGLGLLALAGLLILLPLAPIAIFRIPVLVWAVAVLVVTTCQSWHTSDKALAMAAPIVSYTLGGGLVALVRARNDLGTVVEEFFAISGFMFLLGAAWGVFWLAYRLLDPEVTTGRGGR